MNKEKEILETTTEETVETTVVEEVKEEAVETAQEPDLFENALSHIQVKEENKEKAAKKAEEIMNEYEDKESFTLADITRLMKGSGLGYRQIMQAIKQIGKETEEYAKTQGDDFDRKAFLKAQLESKLKKK